MKIFAIATMMIYLIDYNKIYFMCILYIKFSELMFFIIHYIFSITKILKIIFFQFILFIYFLQLK